MCASRFFAFFSTLEGLYISYLIVDTFIARSSNPLGGRISPGCDTTPVLYHQILETVEMLPSLLPQRGELQVSDPALIRTEHRSTWVRPLRNWVHGGWQWVNRGSWRCSHYMAVSWGFWTW